MEDTFQNRLELGEYNCLVQEMPLTDQESSYKCFRMTTEKLDHLLSLVDPLLSKKSLYRQPLVNALLSHYIS